MSIVYSNTTLCSHSAAAARLGPIGLRINGEQQNDVFTLFRADARGGYGRERAVEVSFLVDCGFSSLSAAQTYAALHFGQLPRQADLIFTDDTDTPVWSLPDALVEAVSAVSIRGVGVLLEYRFSGGAFESEDITLPDGDSDLVKAKVVNLTAGETSKAVTFDSPFAAAPRFVHGVLAIPDGGQAFGVYVRESTRTSEGVTFDFDAAVPASGTYKLLVNAVL